MNKKEKKKLIRLIKQMEILSWGGIDNPQIREADYHQHKWYDITFSGCVEND